MKGDVRGLHIMPFYILSFVEILEHHTSLERISEILPLFSTFLHPILIKCDAGDVYNCGFYESRMKAIL
jgi:hypothetical protein